MSAHPLNGQLEVKTTTVEISHSARRDIAVSMST